MREILAAKGGTVGEKDVRELYGEKSAGGYYIYHLVTNKSVKPAESVFNVERYEAAFFRVWCHIHP